MYKIRVILDTKEDVIRTVLVNSTITLEDLHNIVSKSFGFNAQEMASFYRADDEWNQGEEIPLFNMEEVGEGISMATEYLISALPQVSGKLIYVYDFLAMWTFYVEVIEISDEKVEEPKIILSVGEIPDEAPEKEFKVDDSEDDFNEGGDDFEPFDDYDFYEN